MIAARQIAFGKGGGDTPAYWGLCFTAEEDGSVVAMEKGGVAAPAISLNTSFDGEVWEPFYVGKTSITLNKGERVYFKAGGGGNKAITTASYNYNKFSLTTGKIAASGNVMSLLNGSEKIDTITTSFCIAKLFQNCTSLTTAPELPATTLASYCYSGMFLGCTSLITAPELPTTTLASYCYNQMFQRCTSLTTAPELPATTLVNDCYSRMFLGCTSLTTAPELPATTLVNDCYYYMFQNCERLNEIKVAFTAFSDGTGYWVSGVGLTGTFYCPSALGTNETITREASACPREWTVINTD